MGLAGTVVDYWEGPLVVGIVGCIVDAGDGLRAAVDTVGCREGRHTERDTRGGGETHEEKKGRGEHVTPSQWKT